MSLEDSHLVKPIKQERQPYFRKHFRGEYSCQCGEQLERKYVFCPKCGRQILWKEN